MSNFNDKIKALLAFYASFEEFKSEVVKKEELNNSISELSEELKAAKFDASAFDSARRTFGDEVSVLALAIDKRLKVLEQNNGE